MPKNVILTLFCSILWFDNAHCYFWLEFRVFPPKLGVKISISFYNSNPKRPLLAPRHVFWLMNGQNRCRGLTCAKEQEPKKKTKKGHCLTMLGIAEGERGYPIGLKIVRGPAGPNVMADANLQSRSDSRVVGCDPLKFRFSGLITVCTVVQNCCKGHQPLGLKMRISGCPETRTPTSDRDANLHQWLRWDWHDPCKFLTLRGYPAPPQQYPKLS